MLGCLLIDANAIVEIRDLLGPGDFYAEKHAAIWRAAIALSNRGEPVDVLTLKVQMEHDGSLSRSGGLEYLAELSQKMPTAVSVRHYAQILVDASLRRRLISAGGELTELAFDARATTADILDAAEQRVFGIADSRRGLEVTHIAQLLTETWDLMDKRAQSRQIVHGVPTNYTKLDAVTQGFQPGGLIVLAARPSVGKTSLALNITRNAAVLAQRSVAVFSLEMSKQALVQRLICSEAKVDAFLARRRTGGFAVLPAHRPRHGPPDPGQHLDRRHAGPAHLRAARPRPPHEGAAQHRHGGGRLPAADARRPAGVAGGGGLRHLQRSQVHRQGAEHPGARPLPALPRIGAPREPQAGQLSDLRDSGSIEQDADVVLFLYRPGMHKDDIDRSVTELLVEKNRNGPTTKIDLHFQANQMAFYEPARE